MPSPPLTRNLSLSLSDTNQPKKKKKYLMAFLGKCKIWRHFGA